MARCLKCIHQNVCNSFRIELEHLNGDCADYLSDDVAPRSEMSDRVLNDVLKETNKMLPIIYGDTGDSFELGKQKALCDVFKCLEKIRKKYTKGGE